MHRLSLIRRTILAACAGSMALAVPAGASGTGKARNIVLFIADGASWGSWDAASYYEYGETGRQPYDTFDVRLGVTTNSASTGHAYDPEAAWSRDRDAADEIAGYAYLRDGPTDSAAAATALATGERTLNGRIAIDTSGNPMNTITRAMKAAGKATGTITSVPYNHATPAAFGAQNMSRSNYAEIGDQMIHGDVLDVIMGGGNPMFDASGRRRDAPDFKYVSAATWAALQGADAPRRLLQSKARIEALARGDLDVTGRLLVLPQGGPTLQLGRDVAVVGTDAATASGRALVDGVPTLATMTMAGLQALSGDEDGLFLMVEGGAVDWAAHANDLPGLIEEQMAFNRAVRAGIAWVDSRSGWDDTLMIVMTDHGNGMPMGPDSATIPFQPLRNNGAGNLPGVAWHTNGHTTENTLLWARGPGSEGLRDHVVGTDPHLSTVLEFNDGAYLENRSIAHALRAAAGLGPDPDRQVR